MSKATEKELAKLHRKVTENMLEALAQSTEATALLEKYPDLPPDVVSLLSELATVSPSLLTAATKFLKDNNISCDPSQDEGLGDLANRLKKKRSIGNITEIAFNDE